MNCVIDFEFHIIYFLLINRKPSRVFCLSRGVYEENPLSHYLFIVEVFSDTLRRVENEGKQYRVKIYHTTPPISRLLFVDDSLIFKKTMNNEVIYLEKILKA